MGRPTPPEGAYYKRDMLHGYERSVLSQKEFRYYLSGDLAISPEIGRDKSCVGVWGIDDLGDFYLLPDLYWDRRSSDQSVERILTFMDQYKPMTFFSEKGHIDKSLRPFIEAKMREIVDRDEKIERETWDHARMKAHFQAHGETFKAEWVDAIPAGEEISVYRQGRWLDMCTGPHLPSTGKLGKHFKLMKVSGTYWRGDAKKIGRAHV